MAAIIALHHCRMFGKVVADKWGNDPFVWAKPFVWSHCHARERPTDFGRAVRGPFVRGKDAVFFFSFHPRTKRLVCDSVFVIDQVVPITFAEDRFRASHPIRHYHFDQLRNRYHKKSVITRIANEKLSFVLDPPMPVGAWIEPYLRPATQKLSSYFASPMYKSARLIARDANGLYNRITRWSKKPGNKSLDVLPLSVLRRTVAPSCPSKVAIRWPNPTFQRTATRPLN